MGRSAYLAGTMVGLPATDGLRLFTTREIDLDGEPLVVFGPARAIDALLERAGLPFALPDQRPQLGVEDVRVDHGGGDVGVA